MKSFRLKRLFNPKSGRCFDVAVDHGFFNRPGFIDGIENMGKTVENVVEAGPDAIQLTLGMARHLQDLPGRNKPSLVLRTDVANIYDSTLPENRRFSLMIEDAMLQAVRHDAACVCVNLFQIPGAPEVHAECVQNILRLKPQSDYYGMPMMVEPLVFRPANEGGYTVNGDATAIKHLVRQAVELGADIIKADPTDDLAIYHTIIEVASGVPVLVRGGGRVSDEVILKRTKALIEQGAAGIVYGRNVVQHPNPKGITRALMAMVHENASVEAALAMV